ncbi:PREDICTED: transmembrane protein 218 isoform X4 [Colobus angolensis palliatus]|uniref:transmembrane protein 218 isoform X4 n=1 Tax=Colobus angolensis palliatus TaxID=336983 RepID=UPI0005F3A9CF|nr:PREDICTED: transmembrane protein 218 isoform X4 [Colobus angolensis palliatus]
MGMCGRKAALEHRGHSIVRRAGRGAAAVSPRDGWHCARSRCRRVHLSPAVGVSAAAVCAAVQGLRGSEFCCFTHELANSQPQRWKLRLWMTFSLAAMSCWLFLAPSSLEASSWF